jgi:glycerol-3-phosphate dehydrogenase
MATPGPRSAIPSRRNPKTDAPEDSGALIAGAHRSDVAWCEDVATERLKGNSLVKHAALRAQPPAANEISRHAQLSRLRHESFDLAVIGGGINGAAIARDAAMRGLRVALVDRGDFAGETSSRSSKLIHGGLRYLPQGQLRLVHSALRERERLRHHTAPHLVHPIRFLFPCYRGREPGRFSLWAGLVLYDLLARVPSAERHRRLAADATRDIEPLLSAAGLTGGAMYYDGWGDDARLTLENAIDAAIHGAAIANYVAVEGISRVGSQIAAAAVRDLLGREAFELRARHFVNATGPWLDDVRRMDEPGAAPSVRLTKGVHLVIKAARLPLRNSIVLSDDAARIVFVMPRDGWVTIGTTDTDFDGDRDRLSADDVEIDYLLDVVNVAMPAASISPDVVAYSFAGLRALPIGDRDRAPSKVPREEIAIESASGLLSIAGGKLTTHREIAQKIVDDVMRRLGRPSGRCPTLDTPLPGARKRDVMRGIDARLADPVTPLPHDVASLLASRYGSRASMVAAVIAERPELAARIVAGCPALRAEVVHAIRTEMATSVSDFLVRRTAMVWRDPASAIAAAPEVARMMGIELGWSDERVASELTDFFGTHALRDAGAGRGATATNSSESVDVRNATR